jgi:hypothetical protein
MSSREDASLRSLLAHQDMGRPDVLLDLASLMTSDQLVDALEIARKVPNLETRSRLAFEIGKSLADTESLLLLEKVLKALRATQDATEIATCLQGTAPYLPESLLPEGLSVAATIGDAQQRAAALLVLVPRTLAARNEAVTETSLRLVRATIVALLQSDSWTSLRYTLPALVRFLPSSEQTLVAREAFASARRIAEPSDQAYALLKLISYAPSDLRKDIFSRSLELIENLNNSQFQAQILLDSISDMPEPERAELLSVAYRTAHLIRDPSIQVQQLVRVAQYLAEGDSSLVRSAALAAARQILDPEMRGERLSQLAPLFPEQERPPIYKESLAVFRTIRHLGQRAQALCMVADAMPESEKAIVIAEALGAARSETNADFRASVLAQLVPRLPIQLRATVFREALKSLQLGTGTILPTDTLLWMLVRTLEHVPELERHDVAAEALPAVLAMTSAEIEARTLGLLLPNLPLRQYSHVLAEAVAAALRIPDGPRRAIALSDIGPNLSEAEHARVLTRELDSIAAIEDPRVRGESLVTLLPRLPSSLRDAATFIARNFSDAAMRAWLLGEIVPYLPKREQATVILEAATAADAIGVPGLRAQAFGALAVDWARSRATEGDIARLPTVLGRSQLWFTPPWKEGLGGGGGADTTSESVGRRLRNAIEELPPQEQIYPLTVILARVRRSLGLLPVNPLDTRTINAWVGERNFPSLKRLIVGEAYWLHFQIGQVGDSTLIYAVRSSLPNIDIPDEGMDTEWTVLSATVEIQDSMGNHVLINAPSANSANVWNAHFKLHLPSMGDSPVQSLRIIPRQSVNASISVIIYARGELYRQFDVVLQADQDTAVA